MTIGADQDPASRISRVFKFAIRKPIRASDASSGECAFEIRLEDKSSVQIRDQKADQGERRFIRRVRLSKLGSESCPNFHPEATVSLGPVLGDLPVTRNGS